MPSDRRRQVAAGEFENVAPALVEPGLPRRVAFERFSAEFGPRLRRAFATRFGTRFADDLTAEVLEHAWQRWDEIGEATNPVGLLYRVGCSKARRYRRWDRRLHFPVEPVRPIESNVDVFRALKRLSADQRLAVLAVHGYGWSYAEVAAVLDTTESNVANHVHRGLRRLRVHLGDPADRS